jgi:hypothetical protein
VPMQLEKQQEKIKKWMEVCQKYLFLQTLKNID